MARLALAHGADAAARDRTYRGTPLQWVEHVDAAATGAGCLAGTHEPQPIRVSPSAMTLIGSPPNQT
jgi:hypothetical protein